MPCKICIAWMARLLEGLMTPFKNGLHLLAGSQQPFPAVPTAAELARLFDLLVSHYSYVVVDCGGRMDQTTRLICDLSNAALLVAQTDVVSLVERRTNSDLPAGRRQPRSSAAGAEPLQEDSRLQ